MDRATEAVRRNLCMIPPGEMWESVGERLAARQDLEGFAFDAMRWLKDRSNLSGSTIDKADYAELYRYFRN